MAGKKIEKGSEEWQFFQDYYGFRQKYYEADSEDEWFEKLTKEVDRIFNKYKGTEIEIFVKNLLMAHVDDVDRRSRKKGSG